MTSETQVAVKRVAVEHVAVDFSDLASSIKAAFGHDAIGPEAAEPRKALVDVIEEINAADRDGTSLKGVQLGIFNLLQAGAYRTCRPAYAADYHTHERLHTYPYLLSDYAAFVGVVMDVYKAVAVVDKKHHAKMDALHAKIVAQLDKIRSQVAAWSEADEAAFLASMASLDEKEKASGAEPGSPKYPSLDEIAKGWGSVNKVVAEGMTAVGGKISSELPKFTRVSAAFIEGFQKVDHTGDSKLYLQRSHHVLLDYEEDWLANETRGGAICPMSFWYEEFMPMLLEVCSLGADGYSEEDLVESALDEWFAQAKAERQFEKYGADVVAGWSKCSPAVKLSLKRGWRLTRHYFLGPQKQRERSSEETLGECHRNTGDLTQYVCFLDVCLGRSYVEQGGMRLTFPYFVGPSTWIWHHFIGERGHELGQQDAKAGTAIVDVFKRYLALFVTMCMPS